MRANFIGLILYLFLFLNMGEAQEHLLVNQTANPAFSLQISGFEKFEGTVRIAMFNSEASYNKKVDPLYAVVLPVDSSEVSWSLPELPKGDYAIAIYHDRNENGKLDTNLLGMPKERYGFSNNARGKFGPASWKDARFLVDETTITHEVFIK